MAPSRIVVKQLWTSVSRSEEREIDTNPSSAQRSSMIRPTEGAPLPFTRKSM